MDASTVIQDPERELWFEVFIDYDVDEHEALKSEMLAFHNVRDGPKANLIRFQKAMDTVHENRVRRSQPWAEAQKLDRSVRLADGSARDVFYFVFSDRNAAMLFKLTYC